MEALASIFDWLREQEAGFSAVAAILVIAGVVFAGFRWLLSRRGDASADHVPASSAEAPSTTDSSPTDLDPLTVPGFEGRPAIAVLPFDNLSGDPEQEYFADGIAEDLITLLSARREFPVIARNSSFTYKGRAVDVKRVSRELGVRYVVEGSVRKTGDRVRIAAQLIDATTGAHVWAERYDRELEDIFAIQDEITEAIAGTMGVKLAVTEEARVAEQSPESLTAYELLMRGRYYHSQGVLEGNWDEMQAEARSCFERAIEINPRFAAAFAWMTWSHWAGWFSPSDSPVQSPDEMERAARRSVSLDPELPMAHLSLGLACLFQGERKDAIVSARRAIELDPSFAGAYRLLGWLLADSGKSDEAIAAIEKGMRLSPRDPWLFQYLAAKGWAHFVAQRYEAAVECLKQSLEVRRPPTVNNWFVLAASLAHLDRHEEAAATLREVLTRYERKLTLADMRRTYRFFDPDLLERWLDGLRKAGLPE